jgi:hypothetical protein
MAGQATPSRLSRLAAVLVVGCLLTAVVSLAGGLSRQGAMREATGGVNSLRVAGVQLYSALADADASAAAGYVAGGIEPTDLRARYDRDVAQAASQLLTMASGTAADDPGRPMVATVITDLPVYTGLVETARAHNRLGQPLGQSYLGEASALMRETILPAVNELRRLETTRMARDYGAGSAFPLTVLLVGLGALACLADASLREYRRTNRVINTGIAAGAGLLVIALLWWLVAAVVAEVTVSEAGRHAGSVVLLDDAQAAVLAARANESLVLVARSGAGVSDTGFTSALDAVLGEAGLLARARAEVGDEPDDTRAIDVVRGTAVEWGTAHQQLRRLDDAGQYPQAVASAIGTDPNSSNVRFSQLDLALHAALDVERRSLDTRSASAEGALTGLAIGPALLALLAGAATAAGIAARVREYR